jgi:hypothetical protein
MPRYRLRTLLIVLALAPPALAAAWWGWWTYQQSRQREQFDELIPLIQTTIIPQSSGP